MKKLIITLVVLVIVGVGAYYLVFSNGSSGTPTNTPEPTIQVSTTPLSSPPPVVSIAVDIKNFLFNPQTLTIKKGTKVTWVNNDTAPHTVTSDVGNLLNSPTLASGQSFSFTFTDVGTNNYYCAIHPTMKGSIIVTN
ncbi:MAG: cupredoxin family copper-binding protein [Patescibacteria group bacterium]